MNRNYVTTFQEIIQRTLVEIQYDMKYVKCLSAASLRKKIDLHVQQSVGIQSPPREHRIKAPPNLDHPNFKVFSKLSWFECKNRLKNFKFSIKLML